MLVVAGLLTRAAVVRGSVAAVVPAALVALLGLLVFGRLVTRRDRSARTAAEQGGPGADRRSARAITAVVVLTATAALVTELAHRT